MRRFITLAAAVLALVLTSGCAMLPFGSRTQPTPTEDPRAAALTLQLTAADLGPAWTDSGEPDGDNFPQKICGITVEPAEPRAVVNHQWEIGLNGSYLLQSVRAVGQEQADQVVADLRKKLPGCKPGPEDPPQLTPVELKDPSVVAFKASDVNPKEWWYWIFLSHRGHLVVISTVSYLPNQDLAFLDQVVEKQKLK